MKVGDKVVVKGHRTRYNKGIGRILSFAKLTSLFRVTWGNWQGYYFRNELIVMNFAVYAEQINKLIYGKSNKSKGKRKELRKQKR